MFPLASAGAQPRSRASKGGETAFLAERAPGLKDGAERLLASIVKSLQTMGGQMTMVEGLVVGCKAMALRDLVAAHRVAHRVGAVAAAIECAGLPCTILATLDATLVHSIVELLCGGNGQETMPPRPSTSIDAQYAQIVVTLAAAAIATEWTAQGFGPTKAVKIEGDLSTDICGARVEEVGVATFALGIFGLRGLLTLALPPAALETFAVGPVDAIAPAPEADVAWSSLLHREIGLAPVEIAVMLDAEPLSLRAISELQPGQILGMPVGARSRAALVCDGRTLYRGEIGQDENRYSLRIDETMLPTRPQPPVLRSRKSPLSDLSKA